MAELSGMLALVKPLFFRHQLIVYQLKFASLGTIQLQNNLC